MGAEDTAMLARRLRGVLPAIVKLTLHPDSAVREPALGLHDGVLNAIGRLTLGLKARGGERR